MESQRLNRKLSSLFWYILYGMPLVVFLIVLLSNILYKDSVQLLFSDTLNECYTTFKTFTFDFIYNALYQVLDLIGVNDITSVLSGFIVVVLTWFVQMMLVHVIIDVLTFIFKIYHKLMERVL